jgi:glycosyltransferase involved in cell wall biosynthesis
MKIFFINQDVGSALEYSGNIFLSWMQELENCEILNYKHQNPSPIIYNEIEKFNPDILILNEYFKRVIEATYFWKKHKPSTKIFFINYVSSTMIEKFNDPNEQIFFQDYFLNIADYIFTLNELEPGQIFPKKLQDKLETWFCPTNPEVFKITVPWGQRRKNFLYLGNILPHKMELEFIDLFAKTDMLLDCYGRIFEGNEINENIQNASNIILHGIVPQLDVPEIFNEYKYFVLPHANIPEPFNWTLLQAMFCGTIPLVKNDPSYNNNWLSWADGLYFGSKKSDKLIENMKEMLNYGKDLTPISNAISQTAQERFNYRKMKERFQEILQNWIQK